MKNKLHEASWIWSTNNDDPINQYVEFRHEFDMDNISKEASLYISVDTNYTVWINGRFIDSGQFSDYPDDKTYDTLNVSRYLSLGKNALCILAYYQGKSTSVYKKGTPKLIYSLCSEDSNITSGEDTISRLSPSYKSGNRELISPQLSFTYEYDASKNDNWLDVDYTTTIDWSKAWILDDNVILINRPIKKLDIMDRADMHLLSQGVLTRGYEGNQTIAQIMQKDFLSMRNADEIFNSIENQEIIFPYENGISVLPSALEYDGIYLILDIGKEEVGLFEMDIYADKGCIVDISYGEHLDDMRVRASVGGRNFANRYITASGRQSFTHNFIRMAGRYIQLHIMNISETFTLYYAGIRPTEYPVERLGSFSCSDILHNKIHDISVRTLHLCMHEHYEDCPWREQALYACDSRNQALFGYYSFGEYDFPEASFDLLGKGSHDDGYLELCAPADIPITIPCFSMFWIIEVAEHLMFSGKCELGKKYLPSIDKMLEIYISNLKDDVLASPRGNRYWHFYEWTDGMDSDDFFEDMDKVVDAHYDAPLNFYLILALKNAAIIATACGDAKSSKKYTSIAKRMSTAVHKAFWDTEKNAYVTYLGKNNEKHFSELTQSLALCANTCPDDLSHNLRQTLASTENEWVKISLSHYLFKLEALMMDPDKYSQVIFDDITRDWGSMLFQGATSFWETIKGADDFAKAGSLCHGWSAIPVYFYYAYVLGIKPLEPGFKKFSFNPCRLFLDNAKGIVPTPYGPITINWDKDNCTIDAPDEIQMITNV